MELDIRSKALISLNEFGLKDFASGWPEEKNGKDDGKNHFGVVTNLLVDFLGEVSDFFFINFNFLSSFIFLYLFHSLIKQRYLCDIGIVLNSLLLHIHFSKIRLLVLWNIVLIVLHLLRNSSLYHMNLSGLSFL